VHKLQTRADRAVSYLGQTVSDNEATSNIMLITTQKRYCGQPVRYALPAILGSPESRL
jgi:hypothetical protein